MSRIWALQDAKNRFSEVVDRARGEGAQTVTRRGEAVAVVLSFEDYRRLTGGSRHLVALLRAIPQVDELELERPRAVDREIDLS